MKDEVRKGVWRDLYFRILEEVVQDARKGHGRRVTGGESG